MIIYKDKQYIIFDDGEDRYIYDIENDTFDKPFSKCKLSSLLVHEASKYFETDYLYDLFDAIKVGTYDDPDLYNKMRNFNEYKYLEQIYSAGLKVFMTPSEYGTNGIFQYTIDQIPKGLRKICKKFNLYLNNEIVETYLQYPDIYSTAYGLFDEYKGLKKTNIRDILEYKYRGHGRMMCYFIDELGYRTKDLMLYFDYLKTEKKMRNVKNMLADYCDYVRIALKIGDTFDKYPKNFVEEHDKVVEEYEKNKKELASAKARKAAQEFAERCKTFPEHIKPEYEIEYKDYKFIYPKNVSQIRQEGRNQHNCVGSYIRSVLDGHCDILFLRKKDALNKSLITIEVRNGTIVQARRVCNSNITKEDEEAVNYFNSIFSKHYLPYEDNEEEFELEEE